MTKKLFLIVGILFIGLVLIQSPVKAQESPLPQLPNAGLTPDSPFYFFDKLGEAIQEFFTFNPQSKARLQITFAAERVAEIKVVLETRGVEARGLDVARSRLQANIAKAASIVSVEKSKGRDVSALAQDLSEKFEGPKSALAQTFKNQKQALERQEDELKVQLRAAHRAGDTTQEEIIAAELGKVKARKELLELKEEDIEDDLEAEEERIEEEMEAQRKAEKAIQEAEEEKQDVMAEAAEENVELPADAFAEFDNLLAEAQRNFAEGDFVKARQFAKQAEKSLDKIEKSIEEMEKKQELKEEAEEAIEEAEEEKQEVISEVQEEGVELPADAFVKFDRLLSQAKELLDKGNYQGAKQLAEQAEKSLEDVEKAVEKLEKEKERKEESKQEEEKAREEEGVRREEGRGEETELKEKEVRVIGTEFSFSPSSITVQAGQRVKIIFQNQGGAPHNFTLEGLGVSTKTIGSGKTDAIEFTAPASGTYTFFCSISGHRQAGMEGQLIVE